FAVWLVLATLADLRERRWRLGLAYVGMLTAHMGLAVCVVGVGIVSNYSAERDLRMAPGESQVLAGHRFQFQGVSKRQGPNFSADQGLVAVYRGDTLIAELRPEKRRYFA